MKKNKKIIIIILINLIIFNQFLIIVPQSIKNSFYEYENNDCNISSTVIENFPYVSQQTNFYCTYACPTMIIKYYGFDTELNEILFNSGVGYSLIYSHPSLNNFLLSCIATSNWKSDREFLAKINGLSYEEYRFYNQTYTEEEIWQKYLR